jgi:hypothetical protein
MIGPAGFGQAPSEPAECDLVDGVDAPGGEFSVAEVCKHLGVPLPIEPGHVMSLETYQRLFGKQK